MSRDFELLGRWREGDKAAGSELFERHFLSVRRFFRNKVGLVEGEDLIQRTFLACVEAVPNFRGDSSFRTYVLTIARRELYRFIQGRTVASSRAALDLTVRSIVDLGISPSVAVLQRQEQALVAEAMRRIPVDFQITLELYYWEQMTGRELAAVLGIAPATVRTRLHRAREALREMLQTLRGQAEPVTDSDLERAVPDLQAAL